MVKKYSKSEIRRIQYSADRLRRQVRLQRQQYLRARGSDIAPEEARQSYEGQAVSETGVDQGRKDHRSCQGQWDERQASNHQEHV